ncbi:MAG: hypothetical protein ACR2PK_01690 [Acidimicrobiales bacterium]
MELVFTSYLDAEPLSVRERLSTAVAPALDAAAVRVGAERELDVTHELSTGVRVCSGVRLLDGSEVRVDGEDRLVSLEVRVPWSSERREERLLAANAFAAAMTAGLGCAPLGAEAA